ncbi:hypothetical protein BDA99DRAFT_526776 [Phascolomyces articulosus]|uniref:Uncharacterized protein n=1 Tax=Phascolomyces articulosus TaxID=60185 RepID=A0AAD5JNQ5_9FUNG|nr:hypothetical protein BDA99DRAFT_526776 [Phascolomyces articulosus]
MANRRTLVLYYVLVTTSGWKDREQVKTKRWFLHHDFLSKNIHMTTKPNILALSYGGRRGHNNGGYGTARSLIKMD